MSNATDVIRRAIEGRGFPSDDPGKALGHLRRVEDALHSIAETMASTYEWDADLTERIADIIGRVAPHPGNVAHEGRDPATGVGPIEQYMHDLTEHGFTVYMGDIVDAQGIDDENLGPWEGEES